MKKYVVASLRPLSMSSERLVADMLFAVWLRFSDSGRLLLIEFDTESDSAHVLHSEMVGGSDV